MRACLPLVAAALAVPLTPVRSGAQEVGRSPLELVEYWDGVYNAAYFGYQAALAEFENLDNDWDRLNDEYLQQHESNPARAERVLGEIQLLSHEENQSGRAGPEHAGRMAGCG